MERIYSHVNKKKLRSNGPDDLAQQRFQQQTDHDDVTGRLKKSTSYHEQLQRD